MGGGSTGEARIINITNRTVFVHSFTGSSTYTTISMRKQKLVKLYPLAIRCEDYALTSPPLYSFIQLGAELWRRGENENVQTSKR